MAADTAIQEEEGPAGTSVERNAADVPERVPITPPASVRDSGGFLPIAPGVPATGTGGYITERATPEFIKMIDEQRAKAAAAEQAAVEQVQFNRMLEQSRRTEDALKMIQGYKRLMASRNLENFVAENSPKIGMEKAFALGMIKFGPDIYGGSAAGATVSAIRAARPEEAIPLGETKQITLPSGQTITGVRTGTGSMQLVIPKTEADKEGKLSDVEKSRLSALDKEEAALKKQFPNPPSETEFSFWPPGRVANPQWQQYQSQLADIERRRNQIWLNAQNRTPEKTASGAIPLPPKNQPLKTGQLYNTSKGPAVWNGKQFVKQ